MTISAVEVWVNSERLLELSRMGTLRRQPAGAGDLFSFEYDPAWLRRDEILAFDPDLALVQGRQYPRADRQTFGIFMDSSPDRWGRVLMQRRELMRSRQENRRPRILTEWDFLLGVHDSTRLGALRFREALDRPFLDNDEALAAPPLTSLRELQSASLNLEEHLDEVDHPDYAKWLFQLLAPGSSLGGARPKASVRDEKGSLWLAKFPSKEDTRDIGAWEILASRLAARSGIRVPETRPLRLPGTPYTTFLAKRFDRTEQDRRVAFVSAMTLTQRQDGEPGASYLELVDLLQSRGAHTETDCEQLFRRVVFNILIHNTDDHLRNHGFFLEPQGIRLSPAYDVNPSVDRQELSLSINEIENTCDVSIALAASRDYGLQPAQAKSIVDSVSAAIANWRREATSLGIPRAEQELMAAAFDRKST